MGRLIFVTYICAVNKIITLNSNKMKLLLLAALALSFASCGIFQAHSYRMQSLSRYDYKHRRFFYYNDDVQYKIGDTVVVDGFKAKIIDVR